MKTPRAPIVLIVLFLIFGFGWQLSSQQRITRWAQMLTLESGGQVYELPQVLEPPQHSTFFSLQLSNAPPFPFRPLDFPVYALGDAYVFDDLDFDWVEARALGLSLFGGSSVLQKGGQIIAADGPPSPGDGGGGGSTNYPFPSAYGYTNGELYLRINAVALAWADLSLHNSEPTYYQLLSKENLEEEGWTLEQTFLGAAETNVTFISNPTLERPQLFFMARQLPQAIRLNFTNTFVTTNLVPATIEGNPTNFAILVNDTNFASATWATFSNAAITVTLGATNGNYDVWFGYINGTTNWSVTRLVLDSVIPSLVITAPSGSTTSQPTIQLQGYSLESLAGLEYTVTNLDGSTSGAGFVTGQDFNTNTFQATTNWFQCFDVPLAEGTNLVTLQAMDLAGNIFTTNLSYTLDFSGDTTAPAITVGWPQNGATVAAASFTLLGAVNDDTAQVKIMGASSETSGLVERGGNFSAGPLALPFATNLFTIIATDAAGNSSTQQLTLHKSVVELTVNLATNLHETNTTVTGSVSHTNQSVWVNGVQATVYTDGSWIATNVPVSAGGSAVFDVYAGTILNDPSGTELTVTQNKPPLVRVASYKEDFFIRHDVLFNSCSPVYHEFSSHLRKWKRGDGGTGQLHYVRSGLAEATRNETWPVEWPSVQNPLVTAVQINGGTVLNGTDAPFLPWQYSRLSDLETYSSNWECVHYGLRSALRTVDTEVEVVTGEGAGMQTILLTATAAENEDRLLGYTPLPLAEYFDHPGTLPIRASDIQIRGKTLTPNPTNPTMGTLLLQLPANSTNDVTPTVTRYYNQNSYTFDVKAEEVDLKIMRGGSNIADTVQTVWVGQQIDLTCVLESSLGAVTNYVWTVPGTKVADYIANATNAFTVPLTNLTSSNVVYYWVKDATNAEVKCQIVVNGQTLTAKATFDVRRPDATWQLTPKYHVAVETNNCDTPGIYRLQTGKTCTTNDVGMYYEYEITDLKGYNSDYIIHFVQAVTIDWKENLDLPDLAPTNYSKFVQMRGLDAPTNSIYPYESWTNSLSGKTDDTPASGLVSPTVFLWRRDAFECYLMFEPKDAPSIPVPLKAAGWGWYGRAARANTNTTPTTYVGIPPYENPQAATGTNCFFHPIWTNNAADRTYTYQDFWYITP